MANIYNPWDPEVTPIRPLPSAGESLSRIAQRHNEELEKSKQISDAYLDQLQQTPDIPLSLNNNTDEAEQALLQQVIQKERPRTKEEAEYAIAKYPLLNQIYALNPYKKESVIDAIVTRVNQQNYGTDVTDNIALGDKDPRDLVERPTVAGEPENPFMRVVKDSIVRPLDALQATVTNTPLMDRNVEAKEVSRLQQRLSSYGKDTQTAIQKVKALNELRKQKEELESKADNLTPSGQVDLENLRQINAKIDSISKSFTDAEKRAFKLNGENYINDENSLNAHLATIRDPIYYSDYMKAREQAEFDRNMQLKYGTSKFNWKNPNYMKDFIFHEFQKVMKDQKLETVEELAPWMVLGALGGGWGWAATAALTAGSGQMNIDDAMNAYYQKYGTTEGFEKMKAFIGGGLNYLCNMYGGKMLSDGIPKHLVEKWQKTFLRETNETMQKIGKAVTNMGADPRMATIATRTLIDRISNAPGAILNKSLDILGKIPELGGLAEKAGSALLRNASLREAKGLTASIEKGIGKGIKTAGGALNNSVVKGATKLANIGNRGAVSMALDNATAQMATQYGNQTGEDINEVMRAAAEGLPVGFLGAYSGLGTAAAGGAIKGINRKTRNALGDYSYKGSDLRREQKFFDQSMGTKELGEHLTERISGVEEELAELQTKKQEVDAKLAEGKKGLANINKTKSTNLENTINQIQGPNGILQNLRDNLAKNAREYVKKNKLTDTDTVVDDYLDSIKDTNNATAEQGRYNALKDLFPGMSNEVATFKSKFYKNEESDAAKDFLRNRNITDKIQNFAKNKADMDVAKFINKDNKVLSEIDRIEGLKKSSEQIKEYKNLEKTIDTVMKQNNAKLQDPNVSNDVKDQYRADNQFYEELKQGLKNSVKSINRTKKETELKRSTEDIEESLTSTEADYLAKNKQQLNKPVLASNNKDYSAEFKDIFQHDATDINSPDTFITGTENKLTTLAQKDNVSPDDLKALYKQYRKERDDAIKLHNAMKESSDNKIYTDKKDITNKAKGLNATTDYSIKTIDFGNGKEAYIVSRVKEPTNQLKDLYKGITAEGNTLKADALIKSNSTLDINTLKQEYEETKRTHSGIKTSWDDFINSTALEKQKEILRIVTAHHTYDLDRNKKHSEERIKKYKKSKENENDQNIFYSDLYNYKGFSKHRKEIQDKRTVKEMQKIMKEAKDKVHKSFEEIGLKDFEKLNPNNNSLQKELVLILNNLGFFETNNAIFETPDTSLTNDKDIVNWLNSLHLSNNNIAQLNAINDFLQYTIQNEFYSQGKDGVLAVKPFHTFFMRICAQLDQIDPASISTEDRVIRGASEEQLSSEAGRAIFNKVMPRIQAFNARAIAQNISTKNNTNYAQLLDWDLSEDLWNYLGDSKIIDSYTKQVLGQFLSQEMELDALNTFELGNNDAFNAIWQLLDIPAIPKDPSRGRPEAERFNEELAKRTDDEDIRNFLLYTKSNQNMPFNQIYELYQDKKGIQNKVINFLLDQPEVLYTLGYLNIYDANGNIQKEVPLTVDNRNDWSSLISKAKRDAEHNFVNLATGTYLNTLLTRINNKNVNNPLAATAQKINMFLHLGEAGVFQKAIIGNQIRQLAFSTLYQELGNVNVGTSKNKYTIEQLYTSKRYPELSSSSTGAFSQDTFNPNAIRKEVTNSIFLAASDQQFVNRILNNAGKIYLYNYIRKHLNELNEPSVLNTISTLMGLYEVGIPRWDEFEARESDTVKAEELETFMDMLASQGFTVDNIEEYVTNLNDSETTALWNKYVDRLTQTKSGKRTFRDLLDIDLGANTDSDRLALARLFNEYVNTHPANSSGALLNNKTSTSNKASRDGRTNTPDKNGNNTHHFDTIQNNNDTNHVLHNTNPNSPDFRKETKRIKNNLILDNAIPELRRKNQDNPSVLAMLDKIEQYARTAKAAFKVNSTRYSLTSKYDAVGENFADYYVNTIAAVALRALPGISSQMTDDFKETLQQRYPNYEKMIKFYEDNNIVDLPTLASEMGKVAAMSLGYTQQGNTTLYNAVVEETGKHCIALLHQMGVVQVGRYDPNTNTYRAAEKQDDKNAFKGTLLVCKITNEGMTERANIDNMDTYRLSANAQGNGSYSILDDILGFESKSKAPLDKTSFMKRYGENSKKAKDWVNREKNRDNIMLNKHKLDDGTEVTITANEGENLIEYVESSNGKEDKYYFDYHTLVNKKDHTEVTPLRLYQICSNMVRPPRLNVENAKIMFNGITSAALVRDLIKELERRGEQDEEFVKETIKQHPNLGYLIDYKDPHEFQGDFAKNIRIKNYQGLRSLLKTAEWMADQDIFNGNNKNIDKGYLELYYDEKNTVNNRFFVDNLILLS